MMKFTIKPMLLLLFAGVLVINAKANGEAARSESQLSIPVLRTKYLDEVKFNPDWTVYKEIASLKIEYKFEECQNPKDQYFKNLNVVFFRFTNLTQKQINVSWTNEIYFDHACTNCDVTDNMDEYTFSIVLEPGETITGNSDQRVEGLYIVSNFIKLSPGMTGTKLTDFKLKNIEIKTIN